ncbi:MAG: 2-amino-4-hydroxy-6-hydroxymethyldihydropteridine diphosphokinase [Symploca sp. SIO2E9]|nr:2-amino-4-hydroxy-6-hydroxymethyldihydropteridine diphosphokinase [Symploca sp. SIO2E9]
MYNSEKFATTKPALSAIALGSNLGDSRAILEAALSRIDQTPGITIKACSSWYKTAPIGPAQPDFLNGCALLEVELSAHKLLETLLGIEQEFGRVRLEHWGPRTLDLDIILFDDLILETPDLQIPHRLMRERAFVLVPLAQITPNWVEPVSGLTVSQLAQRLDCSGVSL